MSFYFVSKAWFLPPEVVAYHLFCKFEIWTRYHSNSCHFLHYMINSFLLTVIYSVLNAGTFQRMCQSPSYEMSILIIYYKISWAYLVGRNCLLQYPRCHFPTAWVEYPASFNICGRISYSVERPVGWNRSMDPLCRPIFQAYLPVSKAARDGEHFGWT